MSSLSIIIITRNEAHDIQACLESVKWANEIVVVDSGSTDDTLKICQQYTNKVFTHTDWQGYGVQKNRALSYATSEWVLSLDADECVSKALEDEIKNILSSSDYQAYSIPFQNYYCGKLIKRGAWHTKPHVRLFKRDSAKFTDDIVHENILINGKMGKLTAPILHYTYNNLEEVIDKINRYSTAGAQHKLHKGKDGGLSKAIAHGFWAFFRSYLLQCGFLDGKAGFMLAISNAEYSYYRYLKLMLLQDNKDPINS